MQQIPITFNYQGQLYRGSLSPVSGSAAHGSLWHLMINNFYRGQLLNTDNGWVFHSQTAVFKELEDYFGDYIIAWYDSVEV